MIHFNSSLFTFASEVNSQTFTLCFSAKDVVGGRFDATQAFVGELSQFNMWDRVLRPVDIMGLANCSAYMPGNVVPWIDANVEVFGGAIKAPLEICEDRVFDS